MTGRWAAACVCACMGTVAIAAPGDLTEIPLPAGWVYASGQSINNDGTVMLSGSRGYQGIMETSVWSASAGHQPLVMPSATSVNGARINDQGWISGNATIDSADRVFRWSSTTGFQLAPAGVIGSELAPNGDIVMTASSQAHVWKVDGSLNPLPETPAYDPAYDRSSAYGVSAQGVVVGAVFSGWGHKRAVMWDESGALLDLGLPDSEWGTAARVVNSAGDIAGLADASTGDTPFLLKGGKDGVLHMLDGGGSYAGVTAIDERGNVVGVNGDDQAALWLSNGTYVDLTAWAREQHPELGSFTLYSATDINEQGVITGTGYFASGRRGYVMDVSGLVPEPAGLLAAAMSAGLLLRRRRGK